MKDEIDYPFTREEYKLLSPEQKKVISAVKEYLIGSCLADHDDLDEESLSELNLLRPCAGCVPEEEIDGDILKAVRKKLHAIYGVAVEMAEEELKARKDVDETSLCLVIEPDYEDTSHIVILDWNRPHCYLHEWLKVWHLQFHSLTGIANEVLRIKTTLIEKVVTMFKPMEIYVLVDGGLVQGVKGAPENASITVLDYDVEGADPEEVKPSPIDGKPCCITKF